MPPTKRRQLPWLVAGLAGAALLAGAGTRCAGSGRAGHLRRPAPAAPGPERMARSRSPGVVTYRLMDGDIYMLAAVLGAQPSDVSRALDRLSPRAPDEWLNISPNGRWLLASTERFGCSAWACLARISSSLRAGSALTAGTGRIHADGFGAISSDGREVVFPHEGGPHDLDLWVTQLKGGRWTTPAVITSASPYARNEQPALSADGRRVLFDCDPQFAGGPGSAVCSVATAGGSVTVVISPSAGPGGSARNEVHHAAFAPDGGIVFEADWRGEQIWRLPPGSRKPVLVSRVHDDNSPCVLPDGLIASLYLDRPGNVNGVHEIRIADANGADGAEILTGHDVLDIGIGCGAATSGAASATTATRR